MRGPMGRGMRRSTARRLNLVDKRCAWCGEVKTLEEFTSDRSKLDGIGTYCRLCDRDRSRAYYAANREAVLAKAAEKRGPQPARFCLECGGELEGRQRVTCGRASGERDADCGGQQRSAR